MVISFNPKLASQFSVRPVASWNVLVDLLIIYSTWEAIGLRIAHLIEIIARYQFQSITTHFRTDNMLDRLYRLLQQSKALPFNHTPSPRPLNKNVENLEHAKKRLSRIDELSEEDSLITNILISTESDFQYNIIAAFISVLQYEYNTPPSNATPEESLSHEKYTQFFMELIKIKDIHWIVHKPWTGGCKILQDLLVRNWKKYSHILPMIPHYNLELKDKIGSGAFGTVYKGVWKNNKATDKLYAIKVVNTNSGSFDEKELRRELMLLSIISHQNLVEFHGACYDNTSDCFMIVTDLYVFSLRDYFDKLSKAKRTLTLTEQCKLCTGIADAIKYLHQLGSIFFPIISYHLTHPFV